VVFTPEEYASAAFFFSREEIDTRASAKAAMARTQRTQEA
jgi:hypothetical protein